MQGSQFNTIIPKNNSPDEPFKSYEQRRIEEEVDKMNNIKVRKKYDQAKHNNRYGQASVQLNENSADNIVKIEENSPKQPRILKNHRNSNHKKLKNGFKIYKTNHP